MEIRYITKRIFPELVSLMNKEESMKNSIMFLSDKIYLENVF